MQYCPVFKNLTLQKYVQYHRICNLTKLILVPLLFCAVWSRLPYFNCEEARPNKSKIYAAVW